MSSRVAIPLAAIVGAIVGFGVGIRFAPDPPALPPTAMPAETPPAPRSSAAPAPLERALEEERRARTELEREVARLRERDEMRVEPADAAETETTPVPEDWSDDALLAAGFPPHEVQRLKARFEAFELELLYLQDEAKREGWSPGQLQIERSALRQGMRNEVGDEDYDAMLYAAGRKNRVIVADVIANSAAEVADLRKGDAILQYGDVRIFDIHALSSSTRQGERGALTEVRYERDGVVLRVFLPRGPIGVRLGRERRLPDRFR